MIETFQNKVVVITGGATGIGFALGKVLGSQGARILIAEPRLNRLQEAVDRLSALDISASFFVCDVSDPEAVSNLADFAWEEEGQVDILLNNAGVVPELGPLVDTPLESLHQVFNVNFFGVWHGCAVFAKRLIEQGTPAAIYNTASENALFTAMRHATSYIASKHAVLGMSEALREEVPDFLHIGTIIPGFVQSELSPAALAKYGMDTDRFAELVVEQMRENARFIVSHAYNRVGVDSRYEALCKAFEEYAPRYDGDDEYDPFVVAKRVQADQQSQQPR